MDTTFNPQTSFTAEVDALALQNDGKILLAGNLSLVGDHSNRPVARLNSGGSVDTGFSLGTFGGPLYDMNLLPNGQILVAAPYISVNGVSRTNVARLNSNGTIDPAFTADPMAGLQEPGDVKCVIGLTNGQVLIGGSFYTINGYTRKGIARLNSDGTLDTAFGRALSPYDPAVRKMVLEPDGKIVIFDNVGSNPHRLNVNGLDDGTFNVGTGVGGIYALAVQADGKILVGGVFTDYNHTNINNIARLNGDGPPPGELAVPCPQPLLRRVRYRACEQRLPD